MRVGSEFYLVFDPWSRRKLIELAQEVSGTVIIAGSFAVDNSTMQHGHPAVGTYTFINQNIQITEYIVSGTLCSLVSMVPFLNAFSRLLSWPKSHLVPQSRALVGSIHHRSGVLVHILTGELAAHHRMGEQTQINHHGAYILRCVYRQHSRQSAYL